MAKPLIQVYLPDEDASEKFASYFIKILKIGDYIGLSGDLGTGKTSFTRFLLRNLLEKPDLEVASPSFSLVNYYENDNASREKSDNPIFIAHADLYRLEDAQEVLELDLLSILQEGILLVEWPLKAGMFLPRETFALFFAYCQNEKGNFSSGRMLTINCLEEERARLLVELVNKFLLEIDLSLEERR